MNFASISKEKWMCKFNQFRWKVEPIRTWFDCIRVKSTCRIHCQTIQETCTQSPQGRRPAANHKIKFPSSLHRCLLTTGYKSKIHIIPQKWIQFLNDKLHIDLSARRYLYFTTQHIIKRTQGEFQSFEYLKRKTNDEDRERRKEN